MFPGGVAVVVPARFDKLDLSLIDQAIVLHWTVTVLF